MRLFVAILAPSEVRSHLLQLQKETQAAFEKVPLSAEQKVDWEAGVILRPRSNWRMTREEQMHITLQFLGSEVTVHQEAEIEKALEGVGGMTAFDMSCIGAGAFLNARHASVLWAGVKSEEAEKLAQAVASALAPLKLIPDKPFSPHITIARNKFGENIEEWLTEQANRVWCETPWKVDSFCLMESVHELGGGYEHRVVKKYELGQR